MIQNVGDVSQAAISRLPYVFSTGIMRGRVNPKDGQVYVAGMSGWNENGRPGLKDSGVERVRYTGKPLQMGDDCKVLKDGLLLEFNFPLEGKTAKNLESYSATQWNYHWTENYGSEMYYPETDEVGTPDLKIDSAEISEDGHRVTLKIPSIHAVNQLRLNLRLKDSLGKDFTQEVYWTINRAPE